MENPGLFPEAALQLFQMVLYCMAYVFGGAATIALTVYVVLVGSEMLSQPPSKSERVNVGKPARPAPVAGENLAPSAAEAPVLASSEDLTKQPVWVNTPSRGAITARALLEADPTES